jgi:hypothetical protein
MASATRLVVALSIIAVLFSVSVVSSRAKFVVVEQLLPSSVTVGVSNASNPFDQSLNTTDSVRFSQVNVGVVGGSQTVIQDYRISQQGSGENVEHILSTDGNYTASVTLGNDNGEWTHTTTPNGNYSFGAASGWYMNHTGDGYTRINNGLKIETQGGGDLTTWTRPDGVTETLIDNESYLLLRGDSYLTANYNPPLSYGRLYGGDDGATRTNLFWQDWTGNAVQITDIASGKINIDPYAEYYWQNEHHFNSQVYLEGTVSGVFNGSRYNIAIGDAVTFDLSTSNGLMIGDNANDKLGFLGATPRNRINSTTELCTGLAGFGLIENCNGGISISGQFSTISLTGANAQLIVSGNSSLMQYNGSTVCTAANGLCASGSADGNNYTVNITVTGTTTKTLNLNRSGIPTNLTASWTDLGTVIERNYTTSVYSTTSNTAYVQLTELTRTLDASSTYFVRCRFITYAALATTGEQLRVNTTGSPTTVTAVYNSQTAANTRNSYPGTNTATNAFADVGSGGTNSRDISTFDAYIVTSGSTSTITYEMKSEISGSNAAYDIGSSCEYTKV